MVHLLVPELPPSALAGDQATSRHRRMDRFCVRARAPTPVRRRGVQAQGDTHTVPSSSKAEAKQRAPPYTLQLPRPDSVGDAPARKACTAGPGQPHRSETRGGVMRGGDGWLSSPCRVVHPLGTSRCGGDSPNSQDVGLGDKTSSSRRTICSAAPGQPRRLHPPAGDLSCGQGWPRIGCCGCQDWH